MLVILILVHVAGLFSYSYPNRCPNLFSTFWLALNTPNATSHALLEVIKETTITDGPDVSSAAIVAKLEAKGDVAFHPGPLGGWAKGDTRPGKLTKSYRKWPFIVDLPIKNSDFPFYP